LYHFTIPQKNVASSQYDVVIVGGGTGGVIAAIAAARQGAKTALVEAKGYVGGIVTEGGTALHSFYNNYKGFNREKVQLIHGIPEELINRLIARGACTGHIEMDAGYNYDSVCTVIDTELYKLVAQEFLQEVGVTLYLQTMVSSAIEENGVVQGILTTSHSGEHVLLAKSFVDCSGYGDLCAFAGAKFTEPNDHSSANSIGVAGVSVKAFYDYFNQYGAVAQYVRTTDKNDEELLIRVDINKRDIPEDFREEAIKIGLALVVTTLSDNYFMFLKLNYQTPITPTDTLESAKASLELRSRQEKAIQLLRKYIPGCENAFIARTSPTICIRRGRCIECDKDISLEEIATGTHFEDDVVVYGFHDESPRITINNGASYGIPYRALLPVGLKNVYATGMMITSDFHAHMSTRNTVACMAQGQAAGIAAALCAQNNCESRALPYQALKEALLAQNVYLTPIK